MPEPVILITGANGQLGKELQALAAHYPAYKFIFLTREELSVNKADEVLAIFIDSRPDYCINCAAYTAVDKAENEQEMAFSVNAEAVGMLASACKQFNTKFIHISTDYVFDGNSSTPYKETDPVNPVNLYGASKLRGEQLCIQYNPDAIIIRTAWVYSLYGNNFVKTMLRLMKERPQLNVVNDQIGAPTWAADLATCILNIVEKTVAEERNWQRGIYHYSNRGRISWYDFAVAIKELSLLNCTINPIPTSQYPTPAKRPSFSLLDTNKMQAAYQC